jgi:hypothetical protein
MGRIGKVQTLMMMIIILNFDGDSEISKYLFTNFRYGVLTAHAVKTFWDVTPYSPVEDYRRLGGTHRFHLRDRKVS